MNKLDPTKSAFVPQSKIIRDQMITQDMPGSEIVATLDPNKKKIIDDTKAIETDLENNMKRLLEGDISIDYMCDMYCNPTNFRKEYLSLIIKVLVDELAYINQYPEKQGKIFSDLFIRIINLDNLMLPKADVIKLQEILNNAQRQFMDSRQNAAREIVSKILNGIRRSNVEEDILSNFQAPLTTVIAPNSYLIIEPPPEAVTEKVFFIINNVSKVNVQEKSSQLSEVIGQEHMIWFAQYIVMKRVTTESNFHDLFIQLIDNMSESILSLKDKILYETYRNIKQLLCNMKSDLSDFNDRQILKNLGKFLGMITLSKNKPILHDDMNLKDLLHEAYNKGYIELHYVVPFVTKTLEAAKDSIVFKPPSPWTMAILKVLKELHEIDLVKLNLKFEVEILCRNLKIDFKQLQPACFLKDKNVRIETFLCRIQNGSPGSGGGIISSNVIEMQPNQSLSSVGDLYARNSRQIQDSQVGSQNSLKALSHVCRTNSSANLISFQQASNQQILNIPHPVGSNIRPELAAHHQGFYPGDVPMNVQNSSGAQIISGQNNFTNMPTDQSHYPRAIGIPYDDLNINNISMYLNVDDIPAPILNNIPTLKRQLIATVEKGLQDCVSPLYERCAKITMITVEQIVLKDFGPDCDINALKYYASCMCRSLTSALCLVNARELFGVHLNTAVKQTILLEYRHANNQDKEQVDLFANQFVATNNDICVAFLQKIISERAVNELDRKLEKVNLENYTADPSKTRQLKPTSQELKVYEQFHRTIPGFQALPHQNPQQNFQSNNPQNYVPQKNIAYESMRRTFYDTERHLHQIDNMCHSDQLKCQLRQIIDSAFLALQNNDPKLIHRLTRDLINNLMNMYHTQMLMSLGPQVNVEIIERIKEIHMSLIRTLQPFEEATGYVSICKLITNVWLTMEDPKVDNFGGPGKFNSEAFAELLKTHMISALAVDAHLSKKIQENNIHALVFTLDLLKYFVTSEKREFTVLNEFDLSSSIESMRQLLNNNQIKLIPDIENSIRLNLNKINQLMELGCLEKTIPCTYLYNGISLSGEFDDPPAMTERTEIMIRRWIEHYCSAAQRNNSTIMHLINSMVQAQVIHTDECFIRFLRLATVYVVERAYNNLKQEQKYYGSRNLTYIEIDAYAMLISSLINKFNLNKTDAKICLLNKSLGIIAGTLLQEHEMRKESFHPMPFQRIFVMLFNELQTVIEEEQQYEFQKHVLSAFVHTFHVIRPKAVPGFVFSWLELIAHRNFVSKILRNNNSDYTHSLYVQLLCDMFIFLRPYLENLHLPRSVQIIYKGTVSLTCLLMHDFPEILINYHSMLCTLLPINCIQLRNIILCTVTKKMQPLPDVLNSNPIEQLSQMEDPIGHCMLAGERIKPLNLRRELDSYLCSRSPVKFLSELVNELKKENDPASANVTNVQLKDLIVEKSLEHYFSQKCYLFKSNGIIHYDVELMNDVLLYLCITAIKVLREKNISLNINTIAHTAQMDIIQSLVLNLDNEGRFLLLNCMVNQLRFPNSHTYYFIFTILYLFLEQSQESVKEQITRVILERIIINRPHPWGLLFVMNELFKNQIYKFWDHKFLHCSEDIENILESVGKGFCSPVPTIHSDDVPINPDT